MTHTLQCKGTQGRSFLNIDGMVEWFQVHPATIRRWVQQGKIPPPMRIGRTARWCPGCVEAHLHQEETANLDAAI